MSDASKKWRYRAIPDGAKAGLERVRELGIAHELRLLAEECAPGGLTPSVLALLCSRSWCSQFVVCRSGTVHQLHFVAGMFGVTQDSAGALAPEFGWAVVHDPHLSSMG